MNKIALLIIALFLTTFANAQGWNYQLNGTPSLPRDIALTATGDGYIYHRRPQNTDGFFTFDEEGTIKTTLSNSFLSSPFSVITQVEKMNDDYIISASPTKLARINSSGNIIWEFDGQGTFSFPQMVSRRLPAFTIKNNLAYFASVDFLEVINLTDGTLNAQYPLSGYTAIAVHSDNTNIVVLVQNNNNQYSLLVLDANGTITSTHNTGIVAYDFIVTSDGFVVVGESNGMATIKTIERNSNLLWSNTYGSGALHSIQSTNGGFITSGSDNLNGVLLKINSSGSQTWLTNFDEAISGISRTRVVNTNYDTGYIFASTTHLIRTDLNGNTSTISKPLYTNGSGILDINNVAAMINPDGGLFWDYNDAYFRTPSDSATNTIFASGLWMGGFDPGGNLKVAAQTYGGSTGNDYQPGYIGSNMNGISGDAMKKVWKVTKTQIKAHRRDFEDNNLIDEFIPYDILTYPARGNQYAIGPNGSPLQITVGYVPFYDRNNDGIYNVYDGDYPIIYGDMQLTWLMNDNTTHTQSMGSPIQMDMIGMLYANECSGDGLVDNTIFLKIKGEYNGHAPLDSFQMGMWTDFDLGCSLDDYVGSLPALNSYYAYNENGIDGQGGCNGNASFGANIPIQSVTHLNRPLNSFMYYDIFGTNVSNTGSASDYYDLLTSTWPDGTPLTYGGNGYDTTVTAGTPTNFAFPGNPSNPNEWSCVSEGFAGTDYRTIAASHIPGMLPGNVFLFETAYITHENIPHPAPDITPVGQRITQVQNYHDNNTLNWDVYLGANPDLTIGQTPTITATIEGGNASANYTYLWSTGATTPTITATAPITYSVTVTNTITGCTKTDAVYVNFPTSTATLMDEMDKIAVFPNPAQDILSIDISALDDENITVQLIDMTGRIVKHIDNQYSDLIRFEVSGISGGVYFVTFLDGELEKIGSKKVVIIE